MKIIAIANHKGGVGKTTTAAALASEFALRGFRVLLIDGDPQANATEIFLNPAEHEISHTLADVIVTPKKDSQAEAGEPRVRMKDVIIETDVPGLKLIPATIQLARFDQETPMAVGRLKRCLREVEDDFDFTFLDTPPHLGMLLSAALAATQYVIVPVQSAPASLRGLTDLVDAIDEARGVNEDIRILGVVCTLLDKRTNIGPEIFGALKEQFKGKTFETAINQQVNLCECPALHKPIQLYAPGSRGAIQYAALADEILAELGEALRAAKSA